MIILLETGPKKNCLSCGRHPCCCSWWNGGWQAQDLARKRAHTLHHSYRSESWHKLTAAAQDSWGCFCDVYLCSQPTLVRVSFRVLVRREDGHLGRPYIYSSLVPFTMPSCALPSAPHFLPSHRLRCEYLGVAFRRCRPAWQAKMHQGCETSARGQEAEGQKHGYPASEGHFKPLSKKSIRELLAKSVCACADRFDSLFTLEVNMLSLVLSFSIKRGSVPASSGHSQYINSYQVWRLLIISCVANPPLPFRGPP